MICAVQIFFLELPNLYNLCSEFYPRCYMCRTWFKLKSILWKGDEIHNCNTPESRGTGQLFIVTEYNGVDLCCRAARKSCISILEYNLIIHHHHYTPIPAPAPNPSPPPPLSLLTIAVRVVAFLILILLNTPVIGTTNPRARSVGPTLALVRGLITRFTTLPRRTRWGRGLQRRIPPVSRHDFSCLLLFLSGIWLFGCLVMIELWLCGDLFW